MCSDNDAKKCSNCKHYNCTMVDKIKDVLPQRKQPLPTLDKSLENKIFVNTGPMSSGKSTDIVAKYGELTHSSGLSCLIIKPSIDTRSPKNYVETFTKMKQKCVSCKSLNFCKEVFEYILKNVHVVFLEEAQFFNDGSLVDFVVKIARIYKKCIYVYALNGDSETELFGDVYKLMSKWDEHRSFFAMCKLCKNGNKGIFSKSLVQKKDQITIGKQGEQYITVCADCYYKDFEHDQVEHNISEDIQRGNFDNDGEPSSESLSESLNTTGFAEIVE